MGCDIRKVIAVDDRVFENRKIEVESNPGMFNVNLIICKDRRGSVVIVFVRNNHNGDDGKMVPRYGFLDGTSLWFFVLFFYLFNYYII